jgi:hypothetical protein
MTVQLPLQPSSCCIVIITDINREGGNPMFLRVQTTPYCRYIYDKTQDLLEICLTTWRTNWGTTLRHLQPPILQVSFLQVSPGMPDSQLPSEKHWRICRIPSMVVSPLKVVVIPNDLGQRWEGLSFAHFKCFVARS